MLPRHGLHWPSSHILFIVTFTDSLAHDVMLALTADSWMRPPTAHAPPWVAESSWHIWIVFQIRVTEDSGAPSDRRPNLGTCHLDSMFTVDRVSCSHQGSFKMSHRGVPTPPRETDCGDFTQTEGNRRPPLAKHSSSPSRHKFRQPYAACEPRKSCHHRGRGRVWGEEG